MKVTENFEEKIGTTFLDYKQGGIYNSYHRHSHEKAINSLLSVKCGTVVLDIGCAKGTYYELLKEKNFKVIYGLDLSQERILAAKEKGYITFHANAENIPLDNLSVDAALCIDMFVHVLKRDSRKKIFSEVQRILKKDGCFIFSIPSKKAYVYGNYGVTKKQIFANEDGIINEYCCLIDFEEIKSYANLYGFTIESITGTQFDLKPFNFVRRIIKDQNYYCKFLPLLDNLLGKTFFKQLGKAVFFRFKKI